MGTTGWLIFAFGVVAAVLLVYLFRREDTEKSVSGQLGAPLKGSMRLKVWRVPGAASPGERVVRFVNHTYLYPYAGTNTLLTCAEARKLAGCLRGALAPGASPSAAIHYFSVSRDGLDVVLRVTRPAFPDQPVDVHLTPSATKAFADILDAAASAE